MERGVLDTLLAIPLAKRIRAVAEDVRSRKDVFRRIPPHELAEALELPDSRQPSTGDGWSFTRYAEKKSLEEWADGHDEVAKLVHRLKGQVSPKRFQNLEKAFAGLPDYTRSSFDFLTSKEREFLEDGIAEEELEGNMMNGMSCLAHCTVKSGKTELEFEAVVEDDGRCITLRTPYDARDGWFKDLSNCVEDMW